LGLGVFLVTNREILGFGASPRYHYHIIKLLKVMSHYMIRNPFL